MKTRQMLRKEKQVIMMGGTKIKTKKRIRKRVEKKKLCLLEKLPTDIMKIDHCGEIIPCILNPA